MASILPISVVIPTYRRERVLLETVGYLLGLDAVAAEILVIDQTRQHEPETEKQLSALQERGQIRWLRLAEPSIPRAMNRGLLEARESTLLFVDDDIRPEPGLIAAHYSAHQQTPGLLVAGRVVQPWEEGEQIPLDGPFRFAGLQPAWIDEFMGGNFSVDRAAALAVGGFDENFVRVAYRFEAEFAHRYRKSGHRIRFEPGAGLHHLKASGGGTREFGDHLTTVRPDHAVGAYYFALRSRRGLGWLGGFLMRPMRAVATRHHLRRPWWIPLTWLAELRGMAWALALAARGPRLISKELPLG